MADGPFGHCLAERQPSIVCLCRTFFGRQNGIDGRYFGLSDEIAKREKLRKLYGMLRWLAADRSAWTSGPARQAVPVQCPTSVFDLQRAPAASMPRIRLRVVDRLNSAA